MCVLGLQYPFGPNTQEPLLPDGLNMNIHLAHVIFKGSKIF